MSTAPYSQFNSAAQSKSTKPQELCGVDYNVTKCVTFKYLCTICIAVKFTFSPAYKIPMYVIQENISFSCYMTQENIILLYHIHMNICC